MSDLPATPSEAPEVPGAAPGKALSPAARRAADAALSLPPEMGGREGPEPTRFGDWEKKGVAVDF